MIVHHFGNIQSILERIADLGADGLQPVDEPTVSESTMADAKSRIVDRICIIGSVQYDDFARLTPNAMEALVQRQILDAAEGGGMILAPTAGPYAVQISKLQQENILRFIQADLRWGNYDTFRNPYG